VCNDWRQEQPPASKRQRKLVRERSAHAANTIGKLRKVSRGQNPFFQQVENERIDRGAYPFHRVERKRISITLVCMQHAERRVQAHGEKREA
jgi:hypothetical protein